MMTLGAEPPVPCFFCNNVVITPSSWHGRRLLLPSSPLKPPFWIITSVKCLVVRDRHDKRLHFFFYIPERLSLTKSVVVVFFGTFQPKMAIFCISQK